MFLENKIFNLYELADQWQKQFPENSIGVDRILSFGADKFLPIYVVIPSQTEMYVYELNKNVNNMSLYDAFANFDKYGVPNRIRTGVTAVKGQCPRPLDDRDVMVELSGIEPLTPCMPCKCSPS